MANNFADIGLSNSAAINDINPMGTARASGWKDTSNHDQMTLAFPVVKDKVDITDWSNKVYYAVQAAVYQLGVETKNKARANAPVDTGALKASIYVTSPASRPDQEDNKPYGRLGAPGKASAGYRRAVEASAKKMIYQGDNVLAKGESISSGNSILSTDLFGSATFRPKAALVNAGMKVGSTTRTYKGNLGRSLGEREFPSYPGISEADHLPFTPMPFSTKEQFWVTVGAAAYYAGFVEFGTGGKQGQRAQPFMGPAVREMERQLERRIAQAIKSVGVKRSKVSR